MDDNPWLVLAALGGITLVGVGLYRSRAAVTTTSTAAAAVPPPAPAPLPPVPVPPAAPVAPPAAPSSTTLQPGAQTVSVPATLVVPGTLTGFNQAPAAAGTSAPTVTFPSATSFALASNGPGSFGYTVQWTDGNGAAQTTTLTATA